MRYIPAKLPKMEVDIERMRQVIINLLSNAIKFSDPGSIVNVKVAVRDGELLFQVIDHGIGIRDEAMAHLFERFYRVEGETVRGGTGLGLYISKQIIDAHGGRIWAESKFGQGSTFSFTLPLNNRKEVRKMAKKILVIEDDPATLRLVDYSLKQEGYQVITASNGLEGIRKAIGESPDLLILDVMLPGMDGFEICYRLKSEPSTAKLPILMFSAKAQEIDKNTGIRVGADDYLTKPSAPSEIVSHVEKLLAKNKGTIKAQEKVSG